MAGTAAGTAKARAAQARLRAERRTDKRNQAMEELGVRRPTVATVEPQQFVERSAGVGGVIPFQSAELARSVLEATAVDAAGHLAKIIRKGGVPHLVRFQAACKVLDMTAASRKPGTGEPDEGRMLAVLDRVASALAMRRAAATATDAPVIGDESGDGNSNAP